MCDEMVPEFIKTINLSKDASVQQISSKYFDQQSLMIKAYSDASFALNEEHSSQIGYVILLFDSSWRVHILYYSRKMSKRVVKSIMAADVYAFYDAFDKSFTIRKDLEKCYSVNFRCISTPIGRKYLLLWLGFIILRKTENVYYRHLCR